MKEGNHFHMVIHAPVGLSGIERHLEKCLMPLNARISGFNGQVILENSGAEWMDFHMDPSMTREMNASGEFFLPAQIAFQMLESMSQALASADFPHWIGLDCEQTGRGFAVHYRYPW
jgi:hypothetical protein